jgi:hypothetical protein
MAAFPDLNGHRLTWLPLFIGSGVSKQLAAGYRYMNFLVGTGKSCA